MHELEGDPGAPAERTRLAWQRSALAIGGSTLGVARFLLESSAPAAVSVALVVLLAGGLTIVALPTAFARARGHRRDRARDLRAFAQTTVLTAGLALVSVLIAPDAWA